MKNEITWATNAKGLGIIFVVLGHVLRGLNNANIYTNNSFKVIDYVISVSYTHLTLPTIYSV